MNKNVLILGASSDIGLELIKLFVKEDYHITAHCNSNNKGLIDNFKKYKKLKIVKKNFLNLNNQNLRKFCIEKFNQKFSIFINLTGYMANKTYHNSDLNSQIESIKINALIPSLILKYIVKEMIKNKYGRILNCSSIGVKFGGGLNSYNYSLSKHTSEFIPSYFKKLAEKNVLYNNLRIGFTDTKIHKKIKNIKEIKKRIRLIPINRSAQKREIADYIYFMVSKKNSFMTSQTVTVSGGE
jgi:NAD(P)-dependent dehydrogenase (short-subunit alcohol dehydrogenase family)